jgi:hypothetical protein
MNNPNTKTPGTFVEMISVRVERTLLESMRERCRRENVTLSHLLRRLMLESDNNRWTVTARR